MLLAAGRILRTEQRVCIVGADGAGAHSFTRATAVRGGRRVGEFVRPGPDSRSAHPAREVEGAVCRNGPGGSMECAVGTGVDHATRAGASGAGFLCGRARACIPRRSDKTAAALRSAGTVLSARHGGLLG